MILPKEDKKVGEIQAVHGFLVAENDRKGYDYDGIASIENAIIVLSDAGRVKIMEICNEVKNKFQKDYPLLKLSEHEIYKIMEEIVYSLFLMTFFFLYLAIKILTNVTIDVWKKQDCLCKKHLGLKPMEEKLMFNMTIAGRKTRMNCIPKKKLQK